MNTKVESFNKMKDYCQYKEIYRNIDRCVNRDVAHCIFIDKYFHIIVSDLAYKFEGKDVNSFDKDTDKCFFVSMDKDKV